jgi:hypothetical protein
MAATQNVSQCPDSIKPPMLNRNEVSTLFGYGIVARLDRGQLLTEGAIGSERRRFRLSRVGHGLRRLNDGPISLAASINSFIISITG